MTEIDRQLHASVMKREAEKERAYQEERARREEEAAQMLGVGGTEMTKQELRKVIDSDRRLYYRTEELNDKLYIHYKGWKELKNLDGWTGLRALYAESNAFEKICGLQNCRALRSLFLQENCIKKIEGLDNCPDLWNLNLSNNFIERIEGLSKLKNLNTLIIAKNKIGINGLSDLDELVGSPIVSLDIQDNKISDPDCLPEAFMQMPGLRVLYLKGNPCAKKIPNYRKSTTVYCKDLRYLDDRPVFEEDRRAAEAFNRGGLEEERAERKRIREEKNAAHDRNMQAFNDMVKRVREEKRERDAMRLEDKYTDDDDPGLEQERKMKQRVEDWKKENEEELRDKDQERAARILKAEREAAAKASGGEETAAEEPAGNAAQAEKEVEEPKQEEEKPKEDTRKLVYEDIWDDVPPLRSSGSSAPPPGGNGATQTSRTAASATPAVSKEVTGFVPASSFQGPRAGQVFKKGDLGLGYYDDPLLKSAGSTSTPSTSTPVASAPSSAPDRGSGTSWYSKYTDKMQASMEGLQNKCVAAGGSSSFFNPPPRRPPAEAASQDSAPPVSAAAVEAERSELQEMD